MKICILGRAPSWREAPFDDKSVKIWTLNDYMYKVVPRFDRYFEVHCPYTYDIKSDQEYYNFLLNNQDKLYIMGQHDSLPNANIINYKALTDKYDEYFTSSIAWMMAEALECDNVTDIYLCGVDLLQQLEYQVQRPCAEYFIGIARGRGIKVHVQSTSTLLKSNGLYGIMK
jgi:hypothetical protein